MSGEPEPAKAQAARADILDGAVGLLVGFGEARPADDVLAAVAEAGIPAASVLDLDTLEEADEVLGRSTVSLLALGPELEAAEALGFVQELPERHSYQEPTVVLVFPVDLRPDEDEDERDPGHEEVLLYDLVHDDRLFFWCREPPPRPELVRLLAAGIEHYRAQVLLKLATSPGIGDARAVSLRKLSTVAETAGEVTDLQALCEPVLEAADELVGIGTGRLWIYDSVLHTLTAVDAPEVERSAVAGLTAFAVRTGKTVVCESSGDDARYDADVDGAPGRLAALPVLGPEGRVTGVLTVQRPPAEAPFDAQDLRLLERLAEHLMPIFGLRAAQPMETLLRTRKDGIGHRLFRSEAVEAHARGFAEGGKPLRNQLRWARFTWWLILSGFFVAVIFAASFRMHEYASGTAVVQVGRRVDVTSHITAPVISVEVDPWQEVVEGQALVLLYGAPEVSEMETLEKEFEQRMRQRLADPGDPAVEASLVAARTALERARDRLAERVVRAPVAGRVGDVRIRPGRHLPAGELLMSIVADADERSVVGLIPGSFGPQLAEGRPLRLTLEGYPDLSFELSVDSVGQELIGPEAAARSLGGAVADTVLTQGPVVLVEASLPSESFSDGRRRYLFRDGMQGLMEIRVRSQPILFHLMPGLERAFRKSGDAGDGDPGRASDE